MSNSIIGCIVAMVHRFIVIFARFIYKFVIYKGKGDVASPIKNPLLLEPATHLAMKIRTKKVTSVEVMKAFIARVKEVNPLLNCVVDERFAEALKEAAEADKLIASGTMAEEEIAIKKPFLGVPISTKNAIKVKGLLHSAGLYYRKDIRGDKDSKAMELMREAGAIPFALTNVPELCMWWETVNCVHGRTNNPYDTNRIVGGSSGGEGAILACGASPFGLGSDIGGSIRIPSFFNGIFGHKPSKYVVSNDGQHPPVHSVQEDFMLSIGPMSRFATDLKPMLKVLAYKEKLPALKLDEPVDVTKLKIYYQENDGGGPLVSPVDKDIQEGLQRVVSHFKNILKVEVNRVNISRTKNTNAIWLANLKAENVPTFETQISKSPNEKINAWVELGKWIFGKSHHTFIALVSALVDRYGVKYGSDEHVLLVAERYELIEEFKDILTDENSVFLYPTHPTVALYHTETAVRPFNFTYTSLINILGMPACNIPLGLGSKGLPIGIQVVANYDNDRLCLAVACELEKVFGGWKNPSR